MPTPRRPWTVRVLELIDQGVTNREAIIEQASPYVPQGHAYRRREWSRLYEERKTRERGVPAREPRPRSCAEIHRIGARVVISQSLEQMVRRGVLIRVEDTYLRVNGR